MRRRMGLFALLLAGCSLPAVEGAACNCDASTIARVSTGETFDNINEAIEVAHEDDALCVGPGTYPLDSIAIERLSVGLHEAGLSIIGAGSDETVLEASDGDETLMYLAVEGKLHVEGLTVSGGRARFRAQELEVKDVALRDYDGRERALALEAYELSVDGLEIGGNQMDYASGLYMLATVEGDVGNLDVHDNRSAAGYLLELHGPLDVHDSRIADNQLTQEQPGFDLMELFGPSTLENVVFERNDFNGPMLRAYDTLDASGVVFTGNTTEYAAVLTLMGASTITDARIDANTGHDGALGLYASGSVDLDSVNIGVVEGSNAPCDIYGDPVESGNAQSKKCLNGTLDKSRHCDAYGCE